MHSRLVCLGGDNALNIQLSGWLERFGWVISRIGEPDLPPSDPDRPIALFVIDEATAPENKLRWVAHIRALEGGPGSTPILLAGGEGALLSKGMSALLPVPLDRDASLAIIANWCGPIADHGFRQLANPIYRLVRLAGRQAADGLLDRFADQLANALDYLDNPDPSSRIAHHIAGLAGMLGFEELSLIWRGIDSGDSIDLSVARARTSAAFAAIRGGKSPAS